MKNILILDTGKEWGGGTNSLLELLRRTDKKKYNFTVLFYHNYCKPNEIFVSFENTFGNKNNPPLPPFDKGGMGGFSGESDIKTEIERLGAEFILFASSEQPFLAKILKEIGRILLFFNRKLRKLYIFWIDYVFRIKKDAESITKLLRGLSIDVLYMNNQPSSNLEGIIAAKNTSIKSLLHSRIETELNSFEVKAVNKWLTKMICVSEGVKESFIRQGIESSKCIVVHNGIDTRITPLVPSERIRQELGIKNDELLIGAVGSLVRRKRFDTLIKAVTYLRTQNTENPPSPPFVKRGKGGFLDKIKCTIVGDGRERESLQREISKNKLDDSVRLTGFKSDAISYINAMDIFVLPSEREGFPRVILEAMLMGKPIVASRIAGPAELVIDRETGFLFQTGNIKNLADCVSELISSPQLRKEMGEAGRKRVVENFSIEKYIESVSKVLNEVAG